MTECWLSSAQHALLGSPPQSSHLQSQLLLHPTGFTLQQACWILCSSSPALPCKKLHSNTFSQNVSCAREHIRQFLLAFCKSKIDLKNKTKQEECCLLSSLTIFFLLRKGCYEEQKIRLILVTEIKKKPTMFQYWQLNPSSMFKTKQNQTARSHST